MRRNWARRIELYALAFFGGIIGQWSIGLAKHLWFFARRHVTLSLR